MRNAYPSNNRRYAVNERDRARKRWRQWEAPQASSQFRRRQTYYLGLLAPVSATWVVMWAVAHGKIQADFHPAWFAGSALVALTAFGCAAQRESVHSVVSRERNAAIGTEPLSRQPLTIDPHWSQRWLPSSAAARRTRVIALAMLITSCFAGVGLCVMRDAMAARDSGMRDAIIAKAVVTASGEIITTPRVIKAVPPQQSDVTILTLQLNTLKVRGQSRSVSSSLTLMVSGQTSRLNSGVTIFAAQQTFPNIADLPPGARIVVEGRLGVNQRVSSTAGTLAVSRVVQVREPGGFRGLPATLRQNLSRLAHGNGINERESGQLAEPLSAGKALMMGLAFGDTRGIPQESLDEFETTSLTHLTAVSGSNLAIVAGSVFLSCRGFLWRRQVKIVLVALVVGFYLLAVGYEASVIRAGLMATLLLAAAWFGRPKLGLPVLLLAAVCLLWFDPFLAINYGFMMSVLATGAIVACAAPCAHQWSRVIRIPYPLLLAVSVTVVAQAACTPVLLFLEPGLPTYAVVANLIASPLVAPITVAALLASVLGYWWDTPAHALVWLAQWPAEAIVHIAHMLAHAPSARLPWPGAAVGAIWATVLIMLGVLMTVFAHKYRLWFVVCFFTACGVVSSTAALGVVQLMPAPIRSPWLVVQCDVGQGDAMLFATGAPGHAVMVDAGPRPDLASRCLEQAGVTVLDALVLTHSHADHVDGLAGVLSSAVVRRVFSPPNELNLANPVQRSGDWSKTDFDLSEYQIHREVVTAGAVLEWGNFRATVVSPESDQTITRAATQEAGGSEGSWANDSSVVLLGTVSGVGFASLGDLEPAAQRQLMRRAKPGRVDIVKVAHHGSSRQHAELYQALRPRVAIFSVGADNSYGHPASKTLTLVRGVGAEILRTDLDGSVALVKHNNILSRRPLG